MKKSQFHVIFLSIFTILLLVSSYTNAQGIYFEHINQKDGLSHYSVNSMYQDEHGLVWIGTRDGLNRYDGNEISTFKQIPGDTTSLFGNNIRTVCGGKDGYIFLYCKSGLIELNLRTEKFNPIFKQDVSTIIYGKENLWVAHLNSIYSYSPTPKKKLNPFISFKNQTQKIRALCESTDRLLYVGTEENGLLVYDKNHKLVKQFNINNSCFRGRWDVVSINEFCLKCLIIKSIH